MENIPDNWGPLVTKKLDYCTLTASFSPDQLRDISKFRSLQICHANSSLEAASTDVSDERRKEKEEDLARAEARRKSADLVAGWTHTSAHKKRYCLTNQLCSNFLTILDRNF